MSDFFNGMMANMQANQPVDILNQGAGAPVATAQPSFMTGLTSVVGGLSSIYRGKIEASGLRADAANMEGEASQDELAGQQEVVMALSRMNKDLASITVAGAASGIGSSGSLIASQNEALEIGERNIATAKSNTRLKSGAKRANARQLSADADIAKKGGLMDAGFGFLRNFQRVARRG